MCPAITAGPIAPGRGLPVYQPATDQSDGACNAPPAVSPRRTSVVCTPITGMVSHTGLATGRESAGRGGAATWPAGTGKDAISVAGVCRWVRSNPTTPTAATTRPASTRQAVRPTGVPALPAFAFRPAPCAAVASAVSPASGAAARLASRRPGRASRPRRRAPATRPPWRARARRCRPGQSPPRWPDEAAAIPQVPGSLDEVLDTLEADHSFLTEGGVFTDDLIGTWIDYKRSNELDPIRLRPHPHEFELYFDI